MPQFSKSGQRSDKLLTTFVCLVPTLLYYLIGVLGAVLIGRDPLLQKQEALLAWVLLLVPGFVAGALIRYVAARSKWMAVFCPAFLPLFMIATALLCGGEIAVLSDFFVRLLLFALSVGCGALTVRFLSASGGGGHSRKKRLRRRAKR